MHHVHSRPEQITFQASINTLACTCDSHSTLLPPECRIAACAAAVCPAREPLTVNHLVLKLVM